MPDNLFCHVRYESETADLYKPTAITKRKNRMPNIDLAERLVSTLPSGIDGLFNPWKDRCHNDTLINDPGAKLERLAAHLDCDPEFIVCGEAPGYQGCRYSGVAFTSERLLLAGSIPRLAVPPGRLTMRRLPWSEPSATIVWKNLYRLGIAERTVLWNALQMHPHKPGNPLSNRTPTQDELNIGEPAMRILVEAFPRAKIIAVGQKSEGLLQEMGIHTAGTVRHPANGGATAFALGMQQIAA